MALSPQALVRGLVSRVLPSSNADSANNDVAIRLWSNGEVVTQPMIRKQHALADEGSYFVLHNNQTAIAPPVGTSFSATAPCFVVTNLDPVKRMYLDYISLTTITAMTCTSGGGPLFATGVIDNGARYTSGGTQLTTAPSLPNMAVTGTALLNAYYGAITAPAATSQARTVFGQRLVRPNVSASVITVIGDNFLFNFGGVENSAAASITIANPSFVPVPVAPVIIGPNQTFLLYTYNASSTPVAGTILPEMGFWLR